MCSSAGSKLVFVHISEKGANMIVLVGRMFGGREYAVNHRNVHVKPQDTSDISHLL